MKGNIEEIKKRYDALVTPEGTRWGGMDGWFDRVYPFSEFIRRGQEIADDMRPYPESRSAFPALWDLLFDVYPLAPTVVT